MLSQEIRKNCLILRPIGRVDRDSAGELERAICAHVEAGFDRIVLDFSTTQCMSSSGLRVVFSASERLKATGGALVMCQLGGLARDVFDMSGCTLLFPRMQSLDEAVSQLERAA